MVDIVILSRIQNENKATVELLGPYLSNFDPKLYRISGQICGMPETEITLTANYNC